MSNPLSDLTAKLYEMNDTLGKARNDYLLKEAERKHFESSLMLKGAGTSIAERKCMAEASDEWRDFHQALARLEAVYEFQKLKMEIMKLDWQSWYLTHKLDQTVMNRGNII